MTDVLGNLVRFHLLPGNRYDTVGVAPLIEGIDFDAILADKAFDANWIIEEMNERGAITTEVLRTLDLYFAEDYHQQYLAPPYAIPCQNLT